MSITDSKYFFCGAADTDPLSNAPIQYGLYEPVTDRFVLTSKFLQPLEDIAILFSGRYMFHICDLTTAVNFEMNLIDNECCYNWTLGSKRGLRINECVKEFAEKETYEAQNLVPATEIDINEPIVQDHEYLLAAFSWVSDGEHNLIPTRVQPFTVAENKFKNLIDLPVNIVKSTQLLKDINNVIFTEFEFKTAEEKVNNIIKNLHGL